jgi:hypothetical protein
LGLAATLYEQELATLALPHPYGFIFIPGGSFGHIDDKAVAAQCLARFYDALSPGGWLILDVRPPARIHTFGAPRQVDHDLQDFPDGSTIFVTGYWDHLEDRRIIRKWNKLERCVDGVVQETEIFDYRERLYDRDELTSDLRRAGFRTIHVTHAYQHDTEPSDTDGFVVSCQK